MSNPVFPEGRGSCAAIGNFDGVHLGHAKLIEEARRLAEAEDLDFLLLTFNPHPRAILGKGHVAISDAAERGRLLRETGARVLEIPFTKRLARLSPEDFAAEWLEPLKVRRLVAGHDFCLGRERAGDLTTLRGLGERWNFTIERVEPLLWEGKPISSTRLREAIAGGDVALAAKLLGRPYTLCGEVVRGEGRGGPMGFPTANLANAKTVVPGDGVYATFALTEGKKYKAVTNIGFNPTFAGEKRTIESFLPGADENLYGKKLCLEFVARLRSEKKFASIDDLKKQIAADVSRANKLLTTPH